MKIPAFLLTIFSLTLICCNSVNDKINENSSPFNKLTENLDSYFEALKDLDKFNGGVLVQKQGKIILFKAYNMDKNLMSSLRISKQSQFDIHSISKSMAQAIIVNLERDNLINRNEKINKYISGFPNGDLITIAHLIKNQSGLPRDFSREYSNLIDKDPEEIIGYIKQESLLFKPGAETLYSNLGYQLLYYIISKISGKPFVQFLDKTLFQPLQMDNTGAHFHLSKNNRTQLVKNHELDDGQLVIVPNIQSDGKNQAKIYSTLDDLLKFIDHVKNEPYKSSLINRKNEIGWSGGGDGILSHAKASIKSDYEFIFFSNYDEIPFGEILETVENIMTNKPYSLPQLINRKPVHLEVSILQKYVGKYRMKEFNNDIFEFRIEDNKLIFYQNGERNTVLNAENDNSFFDQVDSEDYFEFRKSQLGGYKLIFYYKKLEIIGAKLDE